MVRFSCTLIVLLLPVVSPLHSGTNRIRGKSSCHLVPFFSFALFVIKVFVSFDRFTTPLICSISTCRNRLIVCHTVPHTSTCRLPVVGVHTSVEELLLEKYVFSMGIPISDIHSFTSADF